MDQIIESISKMSVNGNRLELPTDEQFSNYAQVKKALQNAGGKYSKCGFVFTVDVQELKDRLCGGEKVNDKKKFQFFATPNGLAARLVELADIDSLAHSVCEPEAGRANILQFLPKGSTAIELMPENVKYLEDEGFHKQYKVIEGDFLKLTAGGIGTFDRFVANPPFTKNQDIDHIKHMFSLLNSDGVIVSMSSTSWITGSQKKQAEFREWLEGVGGTYEILEAGEFKESGTNIKTAIVTIDIRTN